MNHDGYNTWAAAKKRCEDIIALRPDYAEAYNNLAILYEQKKDYLNALKNYAKALNLQPNYVAAHHNLGLLFLKYSHLDEAIVQFKNVIELNPLAISAYHYLGNCYLGKSELDLAKQSYLNVLELNAEHSDTLNNLGVVALKNNEAQLAIDYFTKALAFDNSHEDARNNLAATFMQHDRYENAVRHYQELLQQYSDNTEYHYNIAVAYMNLGHLQKAIDHFNEVLTRNSHHVASLNNLAVICWRLNKKQDAINLLSKALELEPENPNSHYLFSAATHQANYTKAPSEYIKNLFDNYAIQYDTHLCKELQYTLPQTIGDLLENLTPEKKPIALDLGCGTGLLAPYLKLHYEYLWGIDLSQKMLDNAAKTELYEQLVCDDIQHFLDNTEQCFDAIIAAEVLEYFGELSSLFVQVTEHLKPTGLFIFSIELSKEKDFILQQTARFAHAKDYIYTIANQNKLSIINEISLSARLQNDEPLDSCLFIFKKI